MAAVFYAEQKAHGLQLKQPRTIKPVHVPIAYSIGILMVIVIAAKAQL